MRGRPRPRTRPIGDIDRLGITEREAAMMLLGLYGAHMNDPSVPIPVTRNLAARLVEVHCGLGRCSGDKMLQRFWKLYKLLLILAGYAPAPRGVNFVKRWAGDV